MFVSSGFLHDPDRLEFVHGNGILTGSVRQVFDLDQVHFLPEFSVDILFSFEIMETWDITVVFTFDRNLEENGFALAAFHDLDTGRE